MMLQQDTYVVKHLVARVCGIIFGSICEVLVIIATIANLSFAYTVTIQTPYVLIYTAYI